MKDNIYLGLICLAMASGLTGCAGQDTFGSSVRQMVHMQEYVVPANQAEPSGLDGKLGSQIMNAYRGHVAEGSQVAKDINISIGK